MNTTLGSSSIDGEAPSTGAGVIAAFIGTTLESYLGATLERVKTIDNEVVNFANMLEGDLAAMAIAALLK